MVNLYANGDHSAALDESGQLYIWGRALVGEHDDDQPRAVFPSLSISEVALGWHHALVLSAGELYTIGAYCHQKRDPPVSENAVAQQLNPTTTSSSYDESSSLSNLEKVPSIHGEQVLQIAAGTEHSALITDKGAVFTWGWGEHGQLGLGDTCDQVVPQRVNLGDELMLVCFTSRLLWEWIYHCCELALVSDLVTVVPYFRFHSVCNKEKQQILLSDAVEEPQGTQQDLANVWNYGWMNGSPALVCLK